MNANMTLAAAQPHVEALAGLRGILESPRKTTIIRLRWLVVVICGYLLLFSRSTLVEPALLQGFALLYLSSNALLYFIDERGFESSYFFSPLVIFDTLCLTFSLVATGQLGSDFYLTYFLIILLSSFWRDFRWNLGFAVVITLVYGALLFVDDVLDSDLFLRAPFLFVSAVFYGYFTELVRSEKTLRERAREADKDFLTGLPNRRVFDEKIGEEFERAQRYRRRFSFLMMDVDDFKKVNDTFGHPSGDEVLRRIGHYLSLHMRDSDFSARYGGEEFAVILPESDLEGAVEAGERIRGAVEGMSFAGPRGKIFSDREHWSELHFRGKLHGLPRDGAGCRPRPLFSEEARQESSGGCLPVVGQLRGNGSKLTSGSTSRLNEILQ